MTYKEALEQSRNEPKCCKAAMEKYLRNNVRTMDVKPEIPLPIPQQAVVKTQEEIPHIETPVITQQKHRRDRK